MDKIYLVVIDIYDEEENSIVDICSSREAAEDLISQYLENAKGHGDSHSYHIDEVKLDSSKKILWDCYENPTYISNYGHRE